MHDLGRSTAEAAYLPHEMHETHELSEEIFGGAHEMHEAPLHEEFHEVPMHEEFHEAPLHEEFHEAALHEELHETPLHEEFHEAGLHEGAFEAGPVHEEFHEHEFLAHELHESGLHEHEELELATELLEVTNEQELDRFLGGLIRRVGRVIRSPVGRMVGGMLKGVAKRLLPIAGTALGTFVGGPAGAMLGGNLANLAGQALGLELEGLSHEDREFEVARRYVRLASSAVQNAARMQSSMSPEAAARAAVIAAARQYAPGLLRPRRCPGSAPYANVPSPSISDVPYAAASSTFASSTPLPAGSRRRGTWLRRGNRIVLFGV